MLDGKHFKLVALLVFFPLPFILFSLPVFIFKSIADTDCFREFLILILHPLLFKFKRFPLYFVYSNKFLNLFLLVMHTLEDIQLFKLAFNHFLISFLSIDDSFKLLIVMINREHFVALSELKLFLVFSSAIFLCLMGMRDCLFLDEFKYF